LLRSNSPSFTPLHDPIRQLVFGAASRDVHMVVVDGRIVVDNARLVDIDMHWLLEQVRAHTEEAIGVERVGEAKPLEALVQEVYELAERSDLGLDAYIRG
jgi:hypothetical protein